MESAFEAPTAELLLDTRTPAELALSPDGSKLAFSLHATVADVGSYVPSDLYVVDTGSDADPVQLTDGAFADVLPAWSPDGSRLAFLSDRITSGHQLPYTMPADGGEPTLAATLDRFGRERRVVERRRTASWCSPPIPVPTGWTGERARSVAPSPSPIRSCGGPAMRGADCS